MCRLAGDTMVWLKIERPDAVVYLDKSTVPPVLPLANTAHIRQSQPDFGIHKRVKARFWHT